MTETQTIECDHDWVEIDSQFTNERYTDVRCSKCRMAGDRDAETAAKLIPHTTSVHNKDVIYAALKRATGRE